MPKVSVVTVNYNGERFLKGLLESIAKQTYSAFETIVVDNASTDTSVVELQRRFPSVRIVTSGTNLGFAGGNNLGAQQARGDLIAFINNDAVVDEYWLERLVNRYVRLETQDHRVGAIAPKVRLFRRFVEITVTVPTSYSADHDNRALGIAVDIQNTGIMGADYDKKLFRAGFYKEECGFDGRIVRWSKGNCSFSLPIPDPPPANPAQPAMLRLTVSGGSATDKRVAEIYCGTTRLSTIAVNKSFTTHEISLAPGMLNQATWLINNAGTHLNFRNGATADRGIFEQDMGQYDFSSPVDAFCGCSFLMNRALFLRFGGFDESFFMYFEDTDLSWRLTKAGYRIFFEPTSVVHHIHAGSSIEWSPSFRYHVTRNQQLMKIKNIPSLILPATLLLLVVKWLFYGVSLVRSDGLPRDLSLSQLTPDQISFKALGTALRMASAMLAKRAHNPPVNA